MPRKYSKQDELTVHTKHYRQKNGLPLDAPTWQRVKKWDDRLDDIIHMISNGATLANVGERYGASVHTVAGVLYNRGLSVSSIRNSK